MYQALILVGNLGKDPEMRYLPSGQAVCNFNVATNRKWTGDDGTLKKETTWFRIAVWGKQAENCNQYLIKGSKVLVEGQLKPDPDTGGPKVWTRQDGTAGASFEVNAQTVRFLSSKDDGTEHEEPEGEQPTQAPAPTTEQPAQAAQTRQAQYDEIPF